MQHIKATSPKSCQLQGLQCSYTLRQSLVMCFVLAILYLENNDN